MSFARTDGTAKPHAWSGAGIAAWPVAVLRRARRRLGMISKRVLPRGLFGRSVLIVGMPLILLQVISVIVFYDRPIDTITWRLAQGLAGDVAMIIDSSRLYSDPEQRESIFDMARRSMDLRIMFGPDDILPNESPEPTGGPLDVRLREALNSKLTRPFLIDWSDRERVAILVQLPDGVLHVGADRKRLFSSTTYIFIIWMVGSSLVLFAIALLFMRNQVRSIRRLAHAAEQFGKGREVPGFKPGGATEVRQAGAAFVVMRQRIQRQIRQRTEMLAGVSHDLRTPLTRMKLQLAMLGGGPEVGALKADVEEMEAMVEGYLAFARGADTEATEPVDLVALVEDAVNGARRSGRPIALSVAGDAVLPLRPVAFRRCLMNLIANASRYATRIWVTLTPRDAQVEICVDDDGPGIPAERRDDVFRPFFRLDESRNPETGGLGLGLAIARDVVHSHGGDIRLDDAPQGGLRVMVRLPR